ncbi:Flp pilus assembly protein CpaB [Noviherbaspirillum cavernae]|uniref:Flp pilus assembly protein CpaB n=1 Tax=Noviherbaspirillum cavernae TaxID=2320862 RepID=UPI0011C46374|nr:Flp pilus assembly protein CpaB [Noviherbaspirillum cavernae]
MKIQRPNIKINKTWLMLIVAIALSLLTTWLTMQYLKFKEQSIEAEISERSRQQRGETIAVVVPIKSLPPGVMLDEGVVAARNVPVDFIYEDTITVGQFEAMKGQALIRAVEKGKPLRRADVREVFADFSGTLKDGKRAMTINVDEINSVSHMIEPGNLVDLMLILSSSGEGNNNQAVVPFLDQVKVLATGQKVTHDDPATQGSPERRKVSYSNFTLEVTPTQAARLALATELGKIRAVLRNEKDKQEIDYETVNAQNFLEDIRERQKRVALAKSRGTTASTGYIEYIIGGKSNDAMTPAINVPMPAGLPTGIPGAAPAQMADASAAASVAAAPTAVPDNLTQLLKLSLGNNPATAKPSK